MFFFWKLSHCNIVIMFIGDFLYFKEIIAHMGAVSLYNMVAGFKHLFLTVLHWKIMYHDTFFFFYFKALPNVIPQLICFPNKFPFKIQQLKKMYKSDFPSSSSVCLLCCSIFLGEEHKHIFYGKLLVGEWKVFFFFWFLLFCYSSRKIFPVFPLESR